MSLALSLPLHEAAIQGKCDDILKLIDSNKVEVDQQDHEGTTALILACASNQLPVASLLLQKGADPNVQRHTGSGPLFFACQGGFLELVELLLQYNAPVAHSSCEGGCPFLVACQNGHLKTAERLLHHNNDASLLNAKLRDGANGLFLAAQNGHSATVEFLLRRGIDVDGCRKDGTSALYIATQMAHVDICTALLKAGADTNISRKDGSTPLYRAAQKGFADIVRVLLELGKPSLGVLANGSSALHVAAANGDATICQLLIQKGADPGVINKKGDSALSLAQASKNGAVLSVLQSFYSRKEIAMTSSTACLQPSLNSGAITKPPSQSLRPNSIEVSSTSRNLPYARPPGLRYTKPYDVSGCRLPITSQVPVAVNVESQDSRLQQPLLNQILTRNTQYPRPFDSHRMVTPSQQAAEPQYVYRRPHYLHNPQTVAQAAQFASHPLERPASQHQMLYPPQHAYQHYQNHVSEGITSSTPTPSAYRGQNIQGFYNGHYR